jgi:hypothetical protein
LGEGHQIEGLLKLTVSDLYQKVIPVNI